MKPTRGLWLPLPPWAQCYHLIASQTKILNGISFFIPQHLLKIMSCLNLLYIGTIISLYILFGTSWNNLWPFFISLDEKKYSHLSLSLLSSLLFEDILLSNHWCPSLVCTISISCYADPGLLLLFLICFVFLPFFSSFLFCWVHP